MNKNKNKIKSVFMLFICMFLFLSPTISFAEETQSQSQTTYTTKTIGNTSSTATKAITNSSSNDAYVKSDSTLPTYTIDQASAWADKKGFEVVKFLQKIVQPFAIIIFICCAIMTMFGAFGNGQLAGKGIVGMIIAGVMYVVVLYAPELMAFFLNWVRS